MTDSRYVFKFFVVFLCIWFFSSCAHNTKHIESNTAIMSANTPNIQDCTQKDICMEYTKFSIQSDTRRKSSKIAHKNHFIYTNENIDILSSQQVTFGDVWRYYRSKNVKNTKPTKPLPIANEDFENLDKTLLTKDFVVWLGHSSLFISTNGLNILIDPVFNTYASPLPFINRAFKAKKTYSLKDFPVIDIVLITHSHYDHLDKKSIKSLAKDTQLFVVPENTAILLQKYGVKAEKIIELNWWEGIELVENTFVRLKITATPSLHSTKRLGYKTNEMLWLSYVLEIGNKKVFLSGDGGYDKRFKEIGKYFGTFDLALLENGQYNQAWKHSHSFPKETINAAQELHAKVIQPIHWGRFVAGSHGWNEPVEILGNLAKECGIGYNVPQIGEVYIIGDTPKNTLWWQGF